MSGKGISDSWDRGNPYEQYVGRWSRLIAPRFLAWLNLPDGRRWLDVGCGTGALCTAIADTCAPASLTGIEPSAGFLKSAIANLGERANFQQGTATAIPLTGASVDVVVSGFVLNFVPHLRSALAEMSRVVTVGGTIAGYVWDYAGRMELMRYFWDAATEIDPGAVLLDEGVRFPLCNPESLAKTFGDAGLREVDTAAIDIPTPFADFRAYWTPFLGGQGPAPTYAMSLDEPTREKLREQLEARVPRQPDGSIKLLARAWCVRSVRAE